MARKKRELSPFEQKINTWVAVHLTGIKFVDKIFFIDHLKTMIHAGLSIIEALDILSKEMSSLKFRMIIEDIKTQVAEGQQLSDVLAKYPKVFPSIYVKMVASGEISGKLEMALDQVLTQMKKTHELNSSIKGAMIYPSVIVFTMGGIGLMMAIMVLPKLVELFKDFDAELPLPTRVLISITNVLSNPIFLIIILLSIAGLIALFIFLLRRVSPFKSAVHAINLRLPIFGEVIKKINLARFSLTLSSLLQSTIPIIDAVDITADTTSNVHYRNALHDTASRIKSGENMSTILSQYPNIFPPMVTEMVMVGERTGEVDQLLVELSNFYNSEVDKTLKNFTTVIEPIIIIVIGVAVALMAVAVIMPMYTLVQNF